MHDGHHISEPDWDSNGDSVPGQRRWAGVGRFQRVLRHAVHDRRGSEFSDGHHNGGQRGETGCAVLSDTMWEAIIPVQTIHLCPISYLLNTQRAHSTNPPTISRAKLVSFEFVTGIMIPFNDFKYIITFPIHYHIDYILSVIT